MISIVIPAYNEEKTIAYCLTSLAQQKTKESFEVIVVDNNSTDTTAVVAAAFRKKLHLRVLTEKRKGRGPARFTGFNAAKGDVILSTDADTILPTDWIEKMTCHFINEQIIAVTGRCRIEDCSWTVNKLFNIGMPAVMIVYSMLFGHFWLTGSSFAIRKSVYKKAGGFNQTLNGMEDLELGFKVKKYGKIKFNPRSPIITSGRRFDGNVTKGALTYGKSFVGYFFLGNDNAHVSDVR